MLGLWRGIVPKLLQAALQQALIFRIKDMLAIPVMMWVHGWYASKTGRKRRAVAASGAEPGRPDETAATAAEVAEGTSGH